MKMAEKLGVEPRDLSSAFKLKAGDPVTKGEIIAETKGIFGLGKAKILAEYTGIIETISDVTGSVIIREPGIVVGIKAYIEGKISDIVPEEGAVVETRCAMVQGIFGVGGERHGSIRVAVASPSEILEAKHILDSDKGRILVGGSGLTFETLERASKVGIAGIIAGGIKDHDLMKFLGYDIGVAITGQEAMSFSVLVTEGFGFLPMAQRTFELLTSLNGKSASLNGATQIRAGVIRPEVIIPKSDEDVHNLSSTEVFELKQGTSIRVIREPYFGMLGSVTALPAQLVTLESGTQVRVLEATLADGRQVTVPRANVEIIATG
jgi:hypothetical protein